MSEAERTAALYSLLQESTQVQIRFFITVLQQMARSDPVNAFLSPGLPNAAVGDQLEAKMASLGIKSPTAMKSSQSPGGRNFQRQSTGFLSPNSAGVYGVGSPDVAAALAVQRSKMKNNRTSAPGTLLGESRSFGGSTLDNVQEKLPSSGSADAASTPSQRPLSSDAVSATPGTARSPRNRALDDMSPLNAGGSWASMVNTPIMSMLDDSQTNAENNSKLEQASSQLSGYDAEKRRSRQQSRTSGNMPGVLSGMLDQNASGNNANRNPGSPPRNMGNSPQFNNFNIPTMSPNTLAGLQSPSGGMSNPANLQMMNAMAAIGGLNNMNPTQLLALQQQILQSQQQQQAQTRTPSRSAQRMPNFPPGGTATPAQSGGLRSPPTTRLGTANSGPSSAVPLAPEEEVADISVLNDVPAWLRHLRLHKYTTNFEHSNWRDMVMMDDHDLENMGVAALGARRKMLKTFEAVRQKYGMTLPADKQASLNASDAGDLAGSE